MHTHVRPLITLSIAAGLAMVAMAAPATAGNPPGNNGTVKIQARDGDGHPDNEPHQACTFDVEFYGFDAGVLFATATFEARGTNGRVVVLGDPTIFIGEDDQSGAGTATGLDARRTYDLNDELAAFAASGDPNQGVHVWLTVEAEGSRGAGTKHKTFWATGCAVDDDGGGQDT